MAGNFTGNPLIVNAVEVITDSPVRVVAAIFKPAAASDQVVLKDKTGKVVLDLKANASTAELQIPIYLEDTRFMGLTCTTCTSGAVLYLYLNAVCS